MILYAAAPEDMATVRVALIVWLPVRYTCTLAMPALVVCKVAVALVAPDITGIVDVPPTQVPSVVANVTDEPGVGTFTLICRVLPISMAVGLGLPVTTAHPGLHSVCWSMAKVAATVSTVRAVEADAPKALAIMVTVPAVTPVTVVLKTPLELVVPDDKAMLTAPVPD
jgi:hypothetical protein